MFCDGCEIHFLVPLNQKVGRIVQVVLLVFLTIEICSSAVFFYEFLYCHNLCVTYSITITSPVKDEKYVDNFFYPQFVENFLFAQSVVSFILFVDKIVFHKILNKLYFKSLFTMNDALGNVSTQSQNARHSGKRCVLRCT